ncbi:hypothetical protein HDZ31DRAFT_59574 [Schizophyllum fasciatum]
MRLALAAVAPTFLAGLAAAAAVGKRSDVRDPTNPQNLVNCPYDGGADRCSLETQCNRIRINYGSALMGHYVWYNYHPDEAPDGIFIETDTTATC